MLLVSQNHVHQYVTTNLADIMLYQNKTEYNTEPHKLSFSIFKLYNGQT